MMTANGAQIPQAPENPGLEMEIYDNFQAAAMVWQQFEQQADCTPFQSFAWLNQWNKHIGCNPNIRGVVVFVRDAAGPLMLLPLQIETGVLRRLSWMGTEINDYNGPVLARDFASRAKNFDVGAFWHYLRRMLNAVEATRFDYVRLEKMPALIADQPNPFVQLPVSLTPSHAYRTPLGANWDEFYLQQRSSKQKSNDRYRRKKFIAEGEISLVRPTDEAGILANVAELMEQKSRHFAAMGVANLFERPGYKAFFQSLATQEKGLTYVSALDVGGKAIATNLGLVHRGAFYHILTSYTHGELAKYSPGVIHLQEIMKDVIAQGVKVFDFTIGDEPYKLEWCDSKSELFEHIGGTSLSGRAAVAFWSTFQSTKRYIKQNPTLWNAYGKLRVAFQGQAKAG